VSACCRQGGEARPWYWPGRIAGRPDRLPADWAGVPARTFFPFRNNAKRPPFSWQEGGAIRPTNLQKEKTMKTFALTTSTAILLAGTAAAQMFGPDYGTDFTYDRFNEGLRTTGYYDAVDMNDDSLLDQSEYSRGLYADYDRDNDLQITTDEFETGYTRYMGEGTYDSAMYDTYDADGSGYLDQQEFAGFYEQEYGDYYTGLDADQDGLLSEDEYSTGLYNTADVNRDAVITIEEEGWFEGWFDGDDVEAEIQSVGDVY
jgi:hypothetical protein